MATFSTYMSDTLYLDCKCNRNLKIYKALLKI